MADRTAIEWTDATVNFWWGCTKVGPGCDHCYAEAWSRRTGESIWGPGAPRRKIKSALATLARLPAGRRVFVQSMADLFDNEVPLEWLAEAWAAIQSRPDLHIQIVTKRTSIVEKRLAAISATWPAHAGLIISIVNQEEADRDVPRLLDLKGKLGVPWVGLSMEPLLGPVDLTELMYHPCPNALDGLSMDPSTGAYECCRRCDWTGIGDEVALDWVIVGGESGPHARPMHPAWARSLRDQCADAGVPFFFKQWGEFAPGEIAGGYLNPERRAKGYSLWDGRWDECWSEVDGHCDDEPDVYRIGKKRAGNLLDGRLHQEWPK